MRKLANKKTTVFCLILSVLLLAIYVFMIGRPISYGMAYHVETVYEGQHFEGTMRFYSDGSRKNLNTNYDKEQESLYYYKDGYVFFVSAETDEDYNKEVASINEDFDGAINTPFYADEINAFRLVCQDENYSIAYTCTSAIMIAIVGGIVELALIGLTCTSFIACKKAKKEN